MDPKHGPTLLQEPCQFSPQMSPNGNQGKGVITKYYNASQRSDDKVLQYMTSPLKMYGGDGQGFFADICRFSDCI